MYLQAPEIDLPGPEIDLQPSGIYPEDPEMYLQPPEIYLPGLEIDLQPSGIYPEDPEIDLPRLDAPPAPGPQSAVTAGHGPPDR